MPNEHEGPPGLSISRRAAYICRPLQKPSVPRAHVSAGHHGGVPPSRDWKRLMYRNGSTPGLGVNRKPDERSYDRRSGSPCAHLPARRTGSVPVNVRSPLACCARLGCRGGPVLARGGRSRLRPLSSFGCFALSPLWLAGRLEENEGIGPACVVFSECPEASQTRREWQGTGFSGRGPWAARTDYLNNYGALLFRQYDKYRSSPTTAPS